MDTVRALLVGLVALSVALLPLGGIASAMSPDTVLTATQTDCCHDGKPCEKGMDDCGTSAGCVLKCFQLSASITQPVAVPLTASALKRPALVRETFGTPPENPPLPPPRI